MALRATLHDENETWTIRVSSVAAPSHGASDTRRRQHKMLRLQEEGYFLSSPFMICSLPAQNS